jgi:hypothetical protein
MNIRRPYTDIRKTFSASYEYLAAQCEYSADIRKTFDASCDHSAALCGYSQDISRQLRIFAIVSANIRRIFGGYSTLVANIRCNICEYSADIRRIFDASCEYSPLVTDIRCCARRIYYLFQVRWQSCDLVGKRIILEMN